MRLASKLQSFEIQLFVVLLETSFFLWEDQEITFKPRKTQNLVVYFQSSMSLPIRVTEIEKTKILGQLKKKAI